MKLARHLFLIVALSVSTIVLAADPSQTLTPLYLNGYEQYQRNIRIAQSQFNEAIESIHGQLHALESKKQTPETRIKKDELHARLAEANLDYAKAIAQIPVELRAEFEKLKTNAQNLLELREPPQKAAAELGKKASQLLSELSVLTSQSDESRIQSLYRDLLTNYIAITFLAHDFKNEIELEFIEKAIFTTSILSITTAVAWSVFPISDTPLEISSFLKIWVAGTFVSVAPLYVLDPKEMFKDSHSKDTPNTNDPSHSVFKVLEATLLHCKLAGFTAKAISKIPFVIVNSKWNRARQQRKILQTYFNQFKESETNLIKPLSLVVTTMNTIEENRDRCAKILSAP